jgi:hypothetical protein
MGVGATAVPRAWVVSHEDFLIGVGNSRCPDPHAAVNLINQLAVALSCCKHLTPCQSFHMVHWWRLTLKGVLLLRSRRMGQMFFESPDRTTPRISSTPMRKSS